MSSELKSNDEISLDSVLNRIEYTPKFRGQDLGDGVIIVEFDEKNNFHPSIEFGVRKTSKRGQYCYFEIVDFNDCKHGDIISIDSDRRKCVWNKHLKEDNLDEFIDHVNKSLKKLYDNSINK